MTVFVCLDDELGMAFGGRRQSRDGKVVEDIFKECGEKALFISPFSEGLTSPFGRVRVKKNPLFSAGRGDFCFIEDRGVSSYIKKIRRLVIYRWNRLYPADLKFDINPLECGFILGESSELAGNSHERITKEVYVK